MAIAFADALVVLGVEPGTSAEDVRRAYLRLLREHHPDTVNPSALTVESRTLITARINDAYAVVAAVLRTAPGDRVPRPEAAQSARPEAPRSARPAPPRPADPRPPRPANAPPPSVTTSGPRPTDDGERAVIVVAAEPVAAYALLYEAAGQVGNVAYYDRQLGILEIIVRFEGGPSCSVLLTLQRAAGAVDRTEIVCEMESIEAAPTPPIRPVFDALLTALQGAPQAPDAPKR